MTSAAPRHRADPDQLTQTDGWLGALTPALVVGFGAIVVVLLATLVIGLANLRNVYSSSEAVTHTYAVKAALQQVLATAVDAETGERGFIITGEATYLEPYDRARDAIGSDVAQGRALTVDNREQQADLDRLASAVDVKLGELANAIRRRRESGLSAAQAVVATNVGKRTMDGMRAIVARMDAREDALLAVRTGQAAQGYRSAVVTRFVTTGVTLLAVLGLFIGALRVGVERRRATQTAERLRVTVASIGDAVIATDEQGRVTDLNAIAEALTGWTQVEAAGRRIEEVFVIINEETRRPAENPIGQVLREGTIVRLANHTVLLSKDGREVPVDDSAAPIRTANGPVTGVVMVFRDVTERRRTEQERTRLIEAERLARVHAEAANRTKDEFLAMVSHELRTPLNAILGWAEMLRSGALAEARRERALNTVYVNATRQMNLIDELLDVSRIMSGKLRLERSSLDLPSVIRSALDVVQPSADAKHIDLGMEADPSLGPFYADAARLQQILVNLLSNAVKFTPDDGAVRVRVRRADSVVELAVTDTGQGISQAFLPAVFEPFRQAEGSTTRRHGGLGLGLSIVKYLVEAHGGTISAESGGVGRGATFTVRLPIVAVQPDRVDGDVGIVSARAARPMTLHGISVLVVDDDADTIELLAATLEHHGAVVRTAASAAQALEILQHAPVHVLLSDVAMPGEDGYSLIRTVRRLPSAEMSAVPAIALTSLARENDRQQALQAGFQLHLAKPIDSRSLVDAVATLLRQVDAS